VLAYGEELVRCLRARSHTESQLVRRPAGHTQVEHTGAAD
jgi:hypothetical protein